MARFSFNKIMARFNIRFNNGEILKENQEQKIGYLASIQEIAKLGAQVMRNEIAIKRLERLVNKPKITVDIHEQETGEDIIVDNLRELAVKNKQVNKKNKLRRNKQLYNNRA